MGRIERTKSNIKTCCFIIFILLFTTPAAANDNTKSNTNDPVIKILNDELISASQKCDTEKAKQLLDKGADPNARDKSNLSPAYYAAEIHEKEKDGLALLRLLIDRGASFRDIYTNNKVTLLHKAAKPEVAEYLLNLGLDVNARTSAGDTKLISVANSTCNLEFIALLLKHGANVNFRNKNGETALSGTLRAITAPQGMTILSLLLEWGVDGADIDAWNNTALMHTFNAPAYNILINKFPHLINKPNSRGQTPLMSCAHYETPWIASLLFKSKADVNAHDNRGRTAIMYASRKAQNSMLKILLEQGAQINAGDAAGNTALHHALLENGDEETVNILLDHGINVNLGNKAGRTSLDLARERSFIDVVDLLRNHGAKEGVGAAPQFNDYGGRTEEISFDKAARMDGISRIINEYGPTDLDVLSYSEIKEIIRKRTTFYRDSYAEKNGTRMKVELYGPSALVNTGSDRLPYGSFQEKREYYTQAFADAQGYDLRTLHKDRFEDGIVDTFYYTQTQAKKSGFFKKAMFGKTKTWPVNTITPTFEENYGERTWCNNEFAGATIETNYSKLSFFYDSGGLKRTIFAYNGAGILRRGQLCYNQDSRRWTPTGNGLISIIDHYNDRGEIEREEMEGDRSRQDHLVRSVKEYEDGYVSGMTEIYDPAWVKKQNAGLKAVMNVPDRKVLTYTLDRKANKVNYKTEEYSGNRLLRTLKVQYNDEASVRDNGLPLIAASSVLSFRARHTPVCTTLNPEGLVAFLIKDAHTEWEKFAAIFYWETSHIKYNHPCYNNTGPCSDMASKARYIAYSLYGVCENYSRVFAELAGKAVNPLSVSGLVNTPPPGKGKSHMWNIVCVCGEYWQVDCTNSKLFFKTGLKPDDEWYLHFNDYLWNP